MNQVEANIRDHAHGTAGVSAVDALTANIALTADISPAQITVDQNDYDPTGLATASTLRLSSDASRNLTGLAGGADGRVVIIHNIGAFGLVLKDESASSAAANRFALNADVTLGADQAAIFQYDSTSSRWRAVVGSTTAVYNRVVRTAGDITTTSTSLVDVTGATATFTTGARPVAVGCNMDSQNSSLNDKNFFNIAVDAVLELGTQGLGFTAFAANATFNSSFPHQTAALSAAPHTLKMQWFVSAGTGTIEANAQRAFTFWAHEIT